MATLFLAVNATIQAEIDTKVQTTGSTKYFVLKDIRASMLPSGMHVQLKNLLSDATVVGKDSSIIKQHVTC
jgi:secreted protein with Ig-like and vWFA domain